VGLSSKHPCLLKWQQSCSDARSVIVQWVCPSRGAMQAEAAFSGPTWAPHKLLVVMCIEMLCRLNPVLEACVFTWRACLSVVARHSESAYPCADGSTKLTETAQMLLSWILSRRSVQDHMEDNSRGPMRHVNCADTCRKGICGV
jgi:hypothetical protein